MLLRDVVTRATIAVALNFYEAPQLTSFLHIWFRNCHKLNQDEQFHGPCIPRMLVVKHEWHSYDIGQFLS